jgi:hypothetical protein
MRKKIHFFYFQDEEKSVPEHPSIEESWIKILDHQSSILESFKQQGTRHQHKKPRVREEADDEVDDELLAMRSKFAAEAMKDKSPNADC